MVDYAKGKIYKIVNTVDDHIYVGSTCTTLVKRMSQHRIKIEQQRLGRSWKPSKMIRHLRSVGVENARIILIEEFPCENKSHLLRREQYWIDTLKPHLNTATAHRPESVDSV